MMTGFLGKEHAISLAVAVLILVALWAVLRGRSRTVSRTVLGILSLSGIAAIVWYPVAFGELLPFLPLELCSYTAICLPFAVFTGNRRLNNLLLLWSVGAFAALLLNPLEIAWAPGSTAFWMFFLPHVFEAGIPVLSVLLGLTEKDPNQIPFMLAATAVVYTFSHFCNIAINRWYAAAGSVRAVNYMFAEWPENPVLDFFWRILPESYWYGWLFLPPIALFLMFLYLPEILRRGKSGKND